MDKKGIELSINFLVTLLITIVIFGMGVSFIYNLSGKANDLTQISEEELDSRITDLLCSGSQKVCVGTNRKTIRRGETDIFGLEILNILENGANFKVNITKADPKGYKKDNTEISGGDPDIQWIPHSRPLFIKKNEKYDVGIGVQVPNDAVSGTYILNVDVQYVDSGYKEYASLQKLYVLVP